MYSLFIDQVEVERSRVPRRASTTWEEDTDMKALEYVAFLFIFPIIILFFLDGVMGESGGLANGFGLKRVILVQVKWVG